MNSIFIHFCKIVLSGISLTSLCLIFSPLTMCIHDHHIKYSMSHRSEWKAPMEIDVRSMHRYCTGECFYLPPTCKDDLQSMSCQNIIAIQNFKPDCQSKVSDPALMELCERAGNLYLISIMRSLSVDIIKTYHAYRMHNYKIFGEGKSSRCSISPFVAIAFSNDTDESVTPTNYSGQEVGDVFYTCVENEPYVSAWIKPSEPVERNDSEFSCFTDISDDMKDKQQSVQLLDTNPYPPMGPGVVWSKIVSRHDQYAMGCKFIVSDNPHDTQLKLNGSGYILIPSPIFRSKYIKVANGFAYKKDGIIEDVLFSNVNTKAKIVAKHLDDNASITALTGITNWHSDKLAYPAVQDKSSIEDLKNSIAEQEVSKFYDLCVQKKALCYVRQEEDEECLALRHCHYLTAIRALDSDFSMIRVHMMSQRIHRTGVFSHVHPNSWMAVGFSNDTKMGRDLVFICQFYGEEEPVMMATYNTNQIPSMDPNDREIVRIRPVVAYVDAENEVVSCIFDVPTQSKRQSNSNDVRISFNYKCFYRHIAPSILLLRTWHQPA